MLGNPALNQRGLHEGRIAAAHTLAAWRRGRLARLISDTDRAAFDRDGFVVKPGFLPLDEFTRLRDQVEARRGPAREMVQGNAVTRRIALDPPALSQLPAVQRLLAKPEWKGLLRYAGSYDSEPVTYIQTILSHATVGPDDPQCSLHSDTFHPTVKAWLFLTDVAEDEGPFTYVPGSHRLTPQRRLWERRMSVTMRDQPDRLTRRGSFRIAPAHLPALRLPQARRFAVPANTLIVADTCGFHARAPSAKPTRRVEIWASGRRNPFLPWTGLDPWSIQSLGRRRTPMFWSAVDALNKLGLRPQHWQLREGVSAFDMP